MVQLQSSLLFYSVLVWSSLFFYLSVVDTKSLIDEQPESPCFRYPLTRRSLGYFDAYFLELLVGSPPQKLSLQLDSRNEGLRLFVSSAEHQTPRLSGSVKSDSAVNGSKKNEFSESRKSVKNENGLTQFNSSSGTYNPSQSSSVRFCTSDARCSLSPFGRLPYSCISESRDLLDARFFNYSDIRLTPTSLSPYTCEERSEGSETVEFASGPATCDEPSAIPSALKLAVAPVKFVRRFFPCSNGTTDLRLGSNDSFSLFEEAIFRTFGDDDDDHPLEVGLRNSLSQSHFSSIPNRFLRQSETVDGIFGIAGPACRNSTFLNVTLTESKTSIIGIDFSSSDSPFLSFSNSVNESVLWSERNQPLRPEVQLGSFFTSYDWNLCDVDLGYNESSHWGAEVDLNTACLGLPTPLWNAVMSWIPVDCPKLSDRCHLTSGYDADQKLPALSFALSPNTRLSPIERRSSSFSSSQFDSDSRIEISLDSLIMKSASTQHELCIEKLSGRNGPGMELQSASSSSPSIKLGTMVLRGVSVFIDRGMGRVGGQQTFYPPRNLCINPNCDSWFFKSLNAETGYCEYSQFPLLMFCLIIPSFVVADLFTNIFYWRTVSLAKQRRR